MLLLLFFCSCQARRCWEYQEVVTDCQQFNSALLTYAPSSVFNGIEVQFLKERTGIRGYLSVYSRQIPLNQEGYANIFLSIDGQLMKTEGICLAGCQRVLLPPECTAILMDCLAQNKKCIVAFEGFCEEISTQTYVKLHAKFLAVPTL